MKYPLKYKAAVLHKTGSLLSITDVEFRGPLKIGQVLVKIFYTGICGKQIEEIQGKMGKDIFLPHCLGHEGVGQIVDLGPGVSKVRKQDFVVLHWMKGSGIEAELPELYWKNKKLNSGPITTFSKFSIISENRVTKISSNFDFKLASLLGCVATTGIGSVINDANVKPYDRIAVVGIGALGLCTIFGAIVSRSREIVAFDTRKKALKRALDVGAHKSYNINSNSNLFYNKFDKVFVTSATKKFIEYGYKIIKNSGELILSGVPGPFEKISINSLNVHRNRSLKGSFGGAIIPERDIETYFNLHLNKVIDFNKIVIKTFKFDKINIPIKKMMQKKSEIGRYIIKIN